MGKPELIQDLQNAIGMEDPIYLQESDLADLTSGDLPQDVMLSVGTEKDHVVHVDWDGHLFKRDGELRAHCVYVMTRKYWDAPLGMSFYLDLVKRAVETREKTHGDVRFEEWEDDGAFIHLSYEFSKLPDNLRDAHKEVLRRNGWLQETAESLSERVGMLAAEAAQKASGWGSASVEDLVNTVENAKSTDDKGRSLEELIARLFAAVEGFAVSGRIRTETEEIDISIINASNDARFKREEALILVECKNWTSKCGKNEFVVFKEKLENRKGRCSLGFLVSWNGFKETVTKEMLRGSHERVLIVPLEGRQIRDAVRAGDFLGCIIAAWQQAINT